MGVTPHINIHVCKVEHESKLTINGELQVWVYMNWGYHMSFPHDKEGSNGAISLSEWLQLVTEACYGDGYGNESLCQSKG